MAKNKTRFGSFEVRKVFSGNIPLYYLISHGTKVSGEYKDKNETVLNVYDYFRNARLVARNLDHCFKTNEKIYAE